MGEPEVPADTFRTLSLPLNRPHSATVNKAVDWRGKVTPESARIRYIFSSFLNKGYVCYNLHDYIVEYLLL